jgi:MFS family permease
LLSVARRDEPDVELSEQQQLRPPTAESTMAGPTLALVASGAVAVIALALAGLAGGPYLDFSSLHGWLALFAISAFAALFSLPFALERLMKAAHPERTEHWERAMLLWGAIAAALWRSVACSSRRVASHRQHRSPTPRGC